MSAPAEKPIVISVEVAPHGFGQQFIVTYDYGGGDATGFEWAIDKTEWLPLNSPVSTTGGVDPDQFAIQATIPNWPYVLPGLELRATNGDGAGPPSDPFPVPYRGPSGILAAVEVDLESETEETVVDSLVIPLSAYAGESVRVSVYHPDWHLAADPSVAVLHTIIQLPDADAPIFNAITVNADNSVTVAYTGVDGATGYKYRLDEGAAVDIGTTNPFTIPALAYDTYSLQMLAYDGEADGPWSSAQEFSTFPIHSPAWIPSAEGGTPTVYSNVSTGRVAYVVSEDELTEQQVADLIQAELEA